MNLTDALENVDKLSVGQLKFTKQLLKMSIEHRARALADARKSKSEERDEVVAGIELELKNLVEKGNELDQKLAAKESEGLIKDAARQIYAQKLDPHQQKLVIANEIKKIAERVLMQAEVMGLTFPRLVRISVMDVGEDRSRDVNVYIVDEEDKEASAQAQAEIAAGQKAAVDAVLNNATPK